ncbi:hypothetical protein ZEAMMB73_Zm00001d002879 [Zea mays]|uniref:Uncharacterized protein n=1 Tax=Zea mays TaxID=4577 RepID=A0A1D6E4Z8_MAIZE|nr:hypothetical protein ZEAMMB73_Zm00001d002879 [Zea mays]
MRKLVKGLARPEPRWLRAMEDTSDISSHDGKIKGCLFGIIICPDYIVQQLEHPLRRSSF